MITSVKRIDFLANNIPLVIISSISFTSVMFAIVRVLETIFSLIILVRDIMLFVVIYLSSLVLYMPTESGFFLSLGVVVRGVLLV